MDAFVVIVTESRRKERNPRVGTRFSLGVENEQTGAGRDDRNCLARPSSPARTGTTAEFLFPYTKTSSCTFLWKKLLLRVSTPGEVLCTIIGIKHCFDT